jgi:hypothetical protein
MPAFIAAGSLSHAATTVARSSETSPIHMPYSPCKNMFCECADMVAFCTEVAEGVSPSVRFCMGCVLQVLHICPVVSSSSGGSNPPRLMPMR